MTPTSEDIRREALRLYRQRHGPDLPDPEDDELKEMGLWDEARRRLMRSPGAEAEGELGRYVEGLREELESRGYVVLREEEYEELKAAGSVAIYVKGDYPRYVESPCCELPMRLTPSSEWQCVCCEAKYRAGPARA